MKDIFSVIVGAVGVMMSLGYYPQAYKIWKTKSARDISLSTYYIFALGTFIWTLYGIYLKDLVIIASFSIGIIGSWLVLGLSLYYKKREKQ